MTDKTVIDTLCEHTSVREYTDEPVSEELRRRILNAAFALRVPAFCSW